VHFSSKKILAACLVFLFASNPSLVNATSDAALLTLTERWSQNVQELEELTRSLYAINALLAQENRSLEDQVSRLEAQALQWASKMQGLTFEQERSSSDLNTFPGNFLLSEKGTQEDTTLFSSEKMLSNMINDGLKEKEALRIKEARLKEDIRELEQDNFSQQRQDKELFDRFKDAQLAVRSVLTLEMTAQKEADLFLKKVDFFIQDAYESLSMLNAEEKRLEESLADQKAIYENPEDISDERDALIAKLVMLQVENENLKRDLALQRKVVPTPECLIINPSIESLIAVFKVQSEENKSLKKEFSCLSQSLRRLNKQIEEIKKELRKK